MATPLRAESKDMYSWWWDSHISPKNSKWLLENLADMDSKIKAMIKIVEVDEDSFARRAEMYYKKRPELMKLVEEFYRAYRALAERYDHATGVIRQAHQTMAEAFPNQVPPLLTDDGPVNMSHDSNPRTPEMQALALSSFDPDELQQGVLGLSTSDSPFARVNGDLRNDVCSVTGRKGLKQLNGFENARKGLNFDEVELKEDDMKNDHEKAQFSSESERLGKSETDIQALKQALSELEAEKETGLLQYEQTLERLSKLESEVSQAKENLKGLNERASKAEDEVQSLKEALSNVEAEKETSFFQYQLCLDRISNLESHISCTEQDSGQLNDRVSKTERETELLKKELTQLKVEKETVLAKYMEALGKIANVENKLLLAEDYASRASDRSDRAEREVEALRDTINRVTKEKETAVLNGEKCLEKMANLEQKITHIREEAERLNAEVQDGAAKLKGSQDQCLLLDKFNKNLQSELHSLVQKLGDQNEEISEKHKELGRLWTCVQEERMRFMEAETAFRSLQNLHSKVQEELRSVAAELQKNVQVLKNMELQNQHLEDEVQKAKNENEHLHDLNLSSAGTVKGMQEEIFNLKEGKEKLEQELELQLDQRNGLQKEIYYLKEELSNLRRGHQDVVGQVELVGLDLKSFGLSVKELQGENSKLKEICQVNDVETAALAEKLGVMEKLLETKELLENSVSDLQTELESAREKVKTLDESCLLLMGEKCTLVTEKATLISQLQITTENLENLSEKNTFLKNSLFNASSELEILRAKSKKLEDSCRLLNDQNAVLVTEKQTLASQLETTLQRLEDLGKNHADLELKYSGMKEAKQSTIQRVKELQVCLDDEKRNHADSRQSSQAQIADLENQIRLLKEAGNHMRGEFEEELDKVVNAQFDIFILQKCVQDLKDKNSSLLGYCEKTLEASKLSEKLISELEHGNLEQEAQLRVLSNQTKGLRMGMFRLLEALETELCHAGDYNEEDQRILQHILSRLDNIKTSLCEAWDENQELVIQKSVLMVVLQQLKKDVTDLNAVIIVLGQEIGSRNRQLLVLQKEIHKLLESNEQLILTVREGNQKEVILLTKMENLQEKLFNLQRAYVYLQKENCKVIEDKESLMKAFEDLEEEKHQLNYECSCITGEAIALENLSFVFKLVIAEKAIEVLNLTENMDRLHSDNGLLVEKVRIVEGKLEEVLTENVSLELSLKKSENELEEVRLLNDQMQYEITNGKDLLCLKEFELLEAQAEKVTKGNQIGKLSESYAWQLKECENLHKFIDHLDSQMSKMRTEYEETEARSRILSSELQKGKDEAKLWETVAGTFFTELQSSSVREALIKEKYSELVKAYEVLKEESYSKCMEILQLKERVGALEDENSDINARMAADHSAILSLKDSVASLEKHTIWHKKFDKTDAEGEEGEEHCKNLSEDEPAAAQFGGYVDLQEVQARIQVVEKAVIELKQHTKEGYSTVRSDLDSTMRQIKLLKSRSRSRRGSGGCSKRSASHSEEDLNIGSTKPQNGTSNVLEPTDELLTKDIVLDQVSDCSSYGKNRKPLGSDDQNLELWETIDKGGNIDLTVGKPYRSAAVLPDKDSQLKVVKENKSGRPSFETMVDKELCVDDPRETSKRFLNPHQGDYKRKTLERLASDVQKLTNLQITVQDLKEKLVMIEHGCGKGKGVECGDMKNQLVETDEMIAKLFDYSRRLMKKMETSSSASSFDGSVAADSSDGGSATRRRCSEQACRISEKIGRLQQEVQKIQFHLMKLDNNKAGKGGTHINERNTRILLRDYLYVGGLRTPRRRKKTHFCGCVQPPTTGD